MFKLILINQKKKITLNFLKPYYNPPMIFPSFLLFFLFLSNNQKNHFNYFLFNFNFTKKKVLLSKLNNFSCFSYTLEQFNLNPDLITITQYLIL